MLPKVLVVEDSSLVTKVIQHVARQQADFDTVYAENLAQAKSIIEREGESLFAALVDLHLPDAPHGEVVDYVLGKRINTIVLTSAFDKKKREKLLSKGIVDYITKEGQFSYEYAIDLIKRIYDNQAIKVLVVDDSETSRYFLRNLLTPYGFQVLEADNGVTAVKTLLDNPEIKLLVTDYSMPGMSGFELVHIVRSKFDKFELPIIGLSGEDSLNARLIKAGANDCLCKPFNHDEFRCRVRNHIEMLEYIEKIRKLADRDALTGVYNRRYFFDRGQELYRQAKRNDMPLAAAVLDLDHFAGVNDAYGYEGGDCILKQFTALLNDTLGEFFIARPGGAEFFILLPETDNNQAMQYLARFREAVNAKTFTLGDIGITVTFSAGVTNCRGHSLAEQLNVAGGYLHRAKEAGRDFIIGDDEEADSAAYSATSSTQ